MIEDPRKQQMKALKGEMVRNIIISLLIAVVIEGEFENSKESKMEESPMIEDPRKQQMKALKGEMVRNIIISLLIAVVIFVGLSGLPLSGAPKVKQIASAQATFDGKTVEVSQQDMQIAADLAGGLRRWFGKSEQTMPRAYITYQLTNGTQVIIGANENTIYENGSYYPNKGEKGKLFEQVVEGLFFGGEIPVQPQGK